MLIEPTVQKLRAMRMSGMADAWLSQQSDLEYASLSFDDRFTLLVEAEFLDRDNKRRRRLLRAAKLRLPNACVEGVKCSPERGLERAVLRQLQLCRWLDEATNVLISGKTGTGKTYLACALGQLACRNGRSTRYRRLSALLQEFIEARASGTYTKLIRDLSKADLLIIDDWGIASLDDTARRDLLELLDGRYGSVSTLLTSQLPVKHWHAYIGEPTVADAILDRLVHNAHKIELIGPSLRSANRTQETSSK